MVLIGEDHKAARYSASENKYAIKHYHSTEWNPNVQLQCVEGCETLCLGQAVVTTTMDNELWRRPFMHVFRRAKPEQLRCSQLERHV